jgi:hypothetical protein
MSRSLTIEGFFVGPIWQGIECYRAFQYVAPASGRMRLRDHVLRAVAEHGGDFRQCVVAAGAIHIDRGARSRRVPLDRFPSIRDLVHDDPGWLPNVEDAPY